MKNIPLKVAACVTVALACALSSLFPNNVSAQVKQPAPGDRLSPLERELLAEMNLARTRPAEYAAYLEQLKPRFKGNVYTPPGGGGALTTQEGWAAVEEAIRFLRAAKPIAPFNVADGMCSGAGELVRDQSRSGSTGHKGSDGSYCEQRLMKYGTWAAPVGENLSYGRQSARERVMELIIDDGFSSRGHRSRMFDAGLKVAGVSCGPHSSLGNVCVITMAGGFTARGQSQKAGASKPDESRPGESKKAEPQAPSGAVRF